MSKGKKRQEASLRRGSGQSLTIWIPSLKVNGYATVSNVDDDQTFSVEIFPPHKVLNYGTFQDTLLIVFLDNYTLLKVRYAPSITPELMAQASKAIGHFAARSFKKILLDVAAAAPGVKQICLTGGAATLLRGLLFLDPTKEILQ